MIIGSLILLVNHFGQLDMKHVIRRFTIFYLNTSFLSPINSLGQTLVDILISVLISRLRVFQRIVFKFCFYYDANLREFIIRFSDYFRGDRSWLSHLNSFNIMGEMWRRMHKNANQMIKTQNCGLTFAILPTTCLFYTLF